VGLPFPGEPIVLVAARAEPEYLPHAQKTGDPIHSHLAFAGVDHDQLIIPLKAGTTESAGFVAYLAYHHTMGVNTPVGPDEFGAIVVVHARPAD